MLKPNEIEAISMAFDKPMKQLENRIMQDIVRRIKINGEITRSADWQINRLYELGLAKEDIQKAIQEHLNINDDEIQDMFKNAVESGYVRDKALYDKLGKSFIEFADNAPLQQMLYAASKQTSGELKNITQSLGFAVRQPNGKLKFSMIADYYQKTLDSAMLDIASGAFDYNTVLKRTVSEMTNSGLRTVDYASGWSNRIDVAARRAVMTGVSQVTAKVNEDNAKALGTEHFEVSYHIGARPSHQEWQGRVYTREELTTVCGLGSVTGLCGANCYHDYYPFVPGISERTYTDEQLDKMKAEENTPCEYGGKQYTKYEALQRQRRLETTMRAQRQQIKLLQEGGANEEDIINARCRYRGTSAEYARFSNAMNLPQQRDRVTVDGLGNVVVRKYKSIDKQNKKVIINMGSDKVAEIIKLGNINTQPLEKEFGKLHTDEIVITDERIKHIKLRHPLDYSLFEEYGVQTVSNPDIIIKDCKNEGTVFMVKRLKDTNLNVVIRLVLEQDDKNLKNSVMTFYRIRHKNLIKLEKKNKTLYKKE